MCAKEDGQTVLYRMPNGQKMPRREDEIMATCIMCGGPTYRLGMLGNTLWYRCRNCGIDQKVDQKTSKHYHVLGTLPGCMPNTNDVYPDYESALEGIDWHKEDVLEGMAQGESHEEDGEVYPHLIEYEDENGKLDAFDHVESKHTTFLYYVTECYEEDCLENEEV